MIKLIITDCDGVLTDGRLYYGAEGEALKVFNVKDGTAIKGLMAQGYKFGVVSGRSSEALAKRAEELGLDFCHMGIASKDVAVREIAEKYGVQTAEILFVGDDVNDCAAREVCGALWAVNDATDALKELADITLDTPGGQAVFKEVARRLDGFK